MNLSILFNKAIDRSDFTADVFVTVYGATRRDRLHPLSLLGNKRFEAIIQYLEEHFSNDLPTVYVSEGELSVVSLEIYFCLRIKFNNVENANFFKLTNQF